MLYHIIYLYLYLLIYLYVMLLILLLLHLDCSYSGILSYCISVCQDKRIFMSVPQGGSEHVGKTL
jgi:hypothetical protein